MLSYKHAQRGYSLLASQAQWEKIHAATIQDLMQIDQDEEEMISEIDGNRLIAFTKISDLVVHVVGSGMYDEILLAEVLQAIVSSMKQLLPKGLSSSGVIEEYSKISLAIDDLIYGGHIDQ